VLVISWSSSWRVYKYRQKAVIFNSELKTLNDLIINLKEGKTEALLFGTAKRICTDWLIHDILYDVTG
jgi:hypothetical protein